MAAGTAVVSYDCPHGPAELISPGVDGVLVENGDVTALSAALMDLVTDQERRRTLGQTARLRACAFDADRIAGEWEQHLTALVRDVRPGETRLERIIRRSTRPAAAFVPARDTPGTARPIGPVATIA
jgi:hypothetical protein